MADEHAGKTGRPELAEIRWEGDSLEVLATFPKDVRGSLGFARYRLQSGKQPPIPTRRMESVGAGVYELKEGDQRACYRVIYLSKIENVIYIVHCFEKRSRRTERRDLNTARERLARVRRRIEEQRKR